MQNIRVIFILLCLGLSSLANAKTIDQYLGHVKTLTAKFTQYVFSQGADKPNKSEGRIYVASPNKFRLVYDKPYKQIYVADGQHLWSYDADLEQVTVKPQRNMLANSPAIVLSDPQNIGKAYKVKAQGITQGVNWFYLKPRAPDSGFDHVRLGFAGNNLFAMELFDSFGQKTVLRFSQLQYNARINPSRFTFTPPKGVDVIGDTGKQ